MRTLVFLGAVVIMFLGVGILSGAIGTLALHNYSTGEDVVTYNICADYNYVVHCLRIPKSVMDFLNNALAMPQVQLKAAPLMPERGNYYY